MGDASKPKKGERLNWRQACCLLGCGRTKFYDLVNSGKLPAQRVGERGLWVYRRDCEVLLEAAILDEQALANSSGSDYL